MSNLPYWHTYLCAENAADVLRRMGELLGGKYFTMVTANSLDPESRNFVMLDIHTSQWMTSPIKMHDVKKGAHITWETPGWVMGISTEAMTINEGYNGRPHDYVQLNFEPRKLTIEHYAPGRNFLRWVFVVENHAQENGPKAYYHEPVFE
jgi:hypothetical protein